MGEVQGQSIETSRGFGGGRVVHNAHRWIGEASGRGVAGRVRGLGWGWGGQKFFDTGANNRVLERQPGKAERSHACIAAQKGGGTPTHYPGLRVCV